MKAKKILIAGILMVMLAGTSCGTEERTASAKALSTGKQALEAVDSYLDGNMSYDRTKEKFDEASEDMAYVSEQSREDEHHIKDFAISSDITGIEIYLSSDNWHNDSDSYDKLIESRNKLAEDLGEKKR